MLMLIVGSLLASSVARTSKGILVGVARDASGAVVVNATVTIVGNPRQILWLQLSCWFAVRVTRPLSFHRTASDTSLRSIFAGAVSEIIGQPLRRQTPSTALRIKHALAQLWVGDSARVVSSINFHANRMAFSQPIGTLY